MKDKIETWGGIECTVNRIGDVFFDQCRLSGHDDRLDDLDRIAALGIKTLRYPVLWERVAPYGLDNADWSWTDQRLARMRELGIEPIAGLCHHGSGPNGTSLIDPGFPQKLAKFAAAVAERYPWLTMYTPINEPLTTARFSALYGHWYPHVRNDSLFLEALLNQCQAIALAMKEIRRINPQAQLIQTEDIGKTFSTSTLAYQARFENDRRWLSFDLLCGRELNFRMKRYFRHHGIDDEQLEWFVENPCPPDIVGINHYITSERLLDDRIELYPEQLIGGNGRHRYVDIEAVRAVEKLDNVEAILQEVWERYHLPIAITEAHIGDSVAEQKLWLLERWQAAVVCLEKGIDIRAVTVWALFGSYFWNCLVTRNNGTYEPGVFDTSGALPVETDLAELVRQLANGEVVTPVENHGWWKRPERLHYPVVNISQYPERKAKLVVS